VVMVCFVRILCLRMIDHPRYEHISDYRGSSLDDIRKHFRADRCLPARFDSK